MDYEPFDHLTLISGALISQSFKYPMNLVDLFYLLSICRAPMHSVYNPLIQWRGLSSEPHLHLQNPTLGGPTSPGPSNMPSLGEAFAYAASPKVF